MLRRARRQARETIQDAASRFQVSGRTYIRWEQGDVAPSAVSLLAVAEYLGVDPRALLSKGAS
jgi:transcriptional regulator with XRE-family HTH domain